MFASSTKILIVDDMPAILALVENQLRAMGFKNIFMAEDGVKARDALTYALSKREPFELVISDWNMPNMTGVDLLKFVRADHNFKHLPFVLLTSESERDQVTEAILLGVSNYIVKPFTPKGFEEKIRTVWQKHKPK